jgi:septum formation inhibitor MinC
MSEEIKSTELVVLPIEEQISQELVKANVTDAIIANLKEKYLPLKIAGTEDKETYLIVKDARKDCKALRVIATKICKKGREDATAIQKAWIAKEKEVTDQIAEVEDYLEKQEKEYEADVAKEKEAKKRKQEEQLVARQQILAGMGVLFSGGNFVLGDVAFDFSLIKESDDDIWEETILPKFKEQYEAIQAEQIEKDLLKEEAEAELKRQQEELEQKQKELAEKEAALKLEADRQAEEEKNRWLKKVKERRSELMSLGLSYDSELNMYKGYDTYVSTADIESFDENQWAALIKHSSEYIGEQKAEEAEEKRKDQERKELQAVRFNDMHPYKEYGVKVPMDTLWSLSDSEYQAVLGNKKAAFEKAEDEKRKEIAEKAAKAERERIEEEQRQAEIKKKSELRESRITMLVQNHFEYDEKMGNLGEISEDAFMTVFNTLKSKREEVIRKQEEERKADELLQSSEKVKWKSMMEYLDGMVIHSMRSSQYRKKAAILKEKLEEIKAL